MADTPGRQALLIGEQGTARRFESRPPGVDKRRCHAYVAGTRQPAAFKQALNDFFARQRPAA